MDYFEWSKEYEENAERVLKVIERKKKQLKKKDLTADERKRLSDDIKSYRRIRHELTEIAVTLRDRAGVTALDS